MPLHIIVSPARVFVGQDVTTAHLFLLFLVRVFCLSPEEDGTKSVVLVVLEEEVWQLRVAVVQAFL